MVLGVFVCLCATSSASVWYVDKDNTAAEDGTSWATAFTAIQPAIDAAFTAGGGEVSTADHC
jgi:formylglycine-generating enzyme required for sulfatase activity